MTILQSFLSKMVPVARSGPARRVAASRLFLMVLLCAFATNAFSQVDCFGYKKLLVSRVEGRVFDPSGEPVSNVEVSLVRNSDVVNRVSTGPQGWFGFKATEGKFTIRTKAPGFTSANAILEVRHDPVHLPRRSTLWIILGVGSAKPCPSSTTSHKQFLQILHEYEQQLGIQEKNATQK